MAANRKLLGEIQQVLKKYEEGVLLFDDIWDKVYSAGQQSLKEKYESDLKKEIKKLQRLRDQIKTWISSTEVKDKNQLVEARKVIESKMEQFKVCEKDTKTKAYSKEGLARDSKLDPKEALREEKRNWVNDCLERLQDLINSVEADKEKVDYLLSFIEFQYSSPHLTSLHLTSPVVWLGAEQQGQQGEEQGAGGQVRQAHL
jgi:CCR4-NOT transcription complex subunit 3